MNGKYDTVALVLAIWGTVTGTLALAIQFFGHRRDRAKLHVEPRFVRFCEVPPNETLEIRYSNVGRRPITIDSIYIRFFPTRWRLHPRWWLSDRKAWVPIARGQGYVLQEGHEDERRVSPGNLPEGARLDLAYLVIVRDQARRVWRARIPHAQRAELRQLLRAKQIDEHSFAFMGAGGVITTVVELFRSKKLCLRYYVHVRRTERGTTHLSLRGPMGRRKAERLVGRLEIEYEEERQRASQSAVEKYLPTLIRNLTESDEGPSQQEEQKR